MQRASGDQRAKDGGVDVRVDLDPPMGISGYIKSDSCAFQVKAENFSKGKIPGEMAPKGILRPAILEMTACNGGRQIFSNIAPVHPEVALQALERASLNLDFVSAGNRARPHFALVARSLAYDSSLFHRAVEVLLRFVIAEPEGHTESTHDILKSLFFSHLSGTEALPKERLKVVRELAHSGDGAQQELGISLLRASLEAWHFSVSYGFDFGARKRGYGWWPKTPEDIRSWYKPFIELATDVGKINSPPGQRVRTLLGESLRALWVQAGMEEEITAAAKELSAADSWPAGWLGSRRILQWDNDKISEASLKRLRELEQLLAPRNTKEKICANILCGGTLADDLDEGDGSSDFSSLLEKRQQEAKDLGKAAAYEKDLLSELLPGFLGNNSSGKLVSFGIGVGIETQDPALLMTQAKSHIENMDAGSVNLLFLRGFISGCNQVCPENVSAFLDEALSDDVWARWFPELQVQIELDEIGYARLLKSIESGKTPAWQYRYLAMGRATAPLSVNQVFTLVQAISTRLEKGLLEALDILRMVVFGAKEKDDSYRRDLATACISFLRRLDWSSIGANQERADNDLKAIIEFAVTTSDSEEGATEIRPPNSQRPES